MNSTTTATNDLNTCKSSNRTASTQKAMPGCKILARGLISTAPARKTCSKSGCPASREHSPVARESYSFNPSNPLDARTWNSFGFRPPSRIEGKLTAIRTLPATVNIHLNRACNFGCRYCYAEFAELSVGMIPPNELREILTAIAAAPLPAGIPQRKVNFAGGEPLLHPKIIAMIEYAHGLGLKTSIVTNGSRLTPETLARLSLSLDILTLSVDSTDPATSARIGRSRKNSTKPAPDYESIATEATRLGIRVKINTVVNRFNVTENLGTALLRFMPIRWKILQAKRVAGQNDAEFEQVAASDAEFIEYVARQKAIVGDAFPVIPETAEEMSGSYAMIAPNGCFFDSSAGRHHYGRRILSHGIVTAFQDVDFSESKFVERGGIYE